MADEYYRGVNGKRVKMTPEEVEAMLADRAAMEPIEQADRANQERERAKGEEMRAKGWHHVMDMIDDAADRGWDVVLAEYKVIKDKHQGA